MIFLGRTILLYFKVSQTLIQDDIIFTLSGEVCSMEQMEGIRDQQESLARLHFELSEKQDIPTAMSEDGETIFGILEINMHY